MRILRDLLLVALIGLGAPVVAQEAPRPLPKTDDPAYVRWLEERSMLFQAAKQAESVSGKGVQWRRPYGEPRPREAVKNASVWILDYPASVIPRRGRSVLATWGDPELWALFRKVGIDLLHTGPVKRAGGLRGYEHTPTIDGWFDRISLELDPAFGTDDEYRRMVRVAAENGGSIAGDLVPLHTGLGPDFRLALLGYKDYPGLYTMVEVAREDWGLLPKVDGPWGAAAVPKKAAESLVEKGYLPGLINSNDAAEDAREWSGWAASGEVAGVGGKVRRWVFLHYFKPGQPTLNWLDPSCAAQRVVSGDVTRTIHDLGARVVRLDAVPFLGIEREPGKPLSKHFKHPLSVIGTDHVAMLTRKLGGWSFHELNVPLEDLKKFTKDGPDLSYDFFTRAQVLHALLSGDAAPLRQAYGFLLDAGVDPGTLVHDLQNHDEITYQLVELDHRKDETFKLNGKKTTGKEIREGMLRLMRERAAGAAAPHNKLYRPEKDGVATTFPGFVAAAMGVRDPYNASDDEVERIKRGHLLLAVANAMQPGVFSLSSWDLVGALPVPEEDVSQWAKQGDHRWVNRGGVDLLGADLEAKKSALGLPRAKALYGPIPRQIEDSESFVSQLARLLAARKKCRIAEGELLAAPEVKNAGVCVLVMKLPDRGMAVTALNFSRSEVTESVELKADEDGKRSGWVFVDVLRGRDAGKADDEGRLKMTLPPLAGVTWVGRPN